MRTINGLWLSFTLGFMISCNVGDEDIQETVPELESRIIDQIDSIGQRYLDDGGVMGMTIAVAKKGKVLYNQGFGFIDAVRSQPVSKDVFFEMGSISKLLGATVIMKLVEEGRLSLESSLHELLPDFPKAEDAKKIKLYHLLTHTSGLKDYASVVDSVFIATGVDPTIEDYYDFFHSYDLDFEPGTYYNYSNSGFVLMAMIVEKVTDKSFGEEIERIINQPTGLDIKLIADRTNDKNTTATFEWRDSTLTYRPPWTWIKGDGGLTATSRDLVLFPFYWSNGTIISKQSFQTMCTPATLSDGLNTGYGIGVRMGKFEGEYCVGHTGGYKSTWAVMKYYPDSETSVVVMVNTDSSPADALVVEGFVSLAVLEKEFPDLVTKEIADFDQQPYLGKYQTVDNFYYESNDLSIVSYEGDTHLYKKPTGTDDKGQKLYYLGDNSFGYDQFPMDRIIFEADSTGNIVAYYTYWNGLRNGGLYKKK